MYANLPFILLVSIGLASVSTAYAPRYNQVRNINIVPRQQNRGGNRGQNNQGGNNNNGQNQDNSGGNNNAGGLQLDPANVQDASKADGQEGGGDPGQSASSTDDANFINFCTGKTLTNGQQVIAGSCNGIAMGDIPSQDNMVSSIIISPAPGQDIAADTPFDITVQVSNLAAGSFTNPANTYYAAPQALNGGKVVGHTHVTVQDLGNNLAPQQAPDPKAFVFFKGINDEGNGNGLLSASVTEGLPAGNYRICTMSSSSNHQPVLMPVAQRGAQDDCTKFTVGQGNGNNNGNNSGNNDDNNGNNNNNNNNGNNNGNNNNNDSNNGNNNNNAGNNGNNDNNAGNEGANTGGDPGNGDAANGNDNDDVNAGGDAVADGGDAAGGDAAAGGDVAAGTGKGTGTGKNSGNNFGKDFDGGRRGGRFGGGFKYRARRSFST